MPVLFGHRYLALIVVVVLVVFWFFGPQGLQSDGGIHYPRVQGKAFSDVLNSTLGVSIALPPDTLAPRAAG